MKRSPYRADHAGSFLRPQELSDSRNKWRDGKLSGQELKLIEDRHVQQIVSMQESIGLKGITDGEFRRDYWHLDFIAAFDGVELNNETYGHSFSGGGTVATFKVTDRFGNNNGFMREHFRFLDSITDLTAKFCIPAPGMIYLRSGRAGICEQTYPDLDKFWDDVISAYKHEINALYELGCRYLQFDDVSFAYLCDIDFRDGLIKRGDDPDEMVKTFATAISKSVAERPEDMVITTHMCRGNFQSTWMTQGGYEPVAELMFDNLMNDGFFMEYDTERAGDFEPLRFAHEDQHIVLGLISSKVAQLENKDQIKRQIEKATNFIPIERLSLSPQCGFSSTHHGNNLTLDDQKRKLELLVQVAIDIWGEV